MKQILIRIDLFDTVKWIKIDASPIREEWAKGLNLWVHHPRLLDGSFAKSWKVTEAKTGTALPFGPWGLRKDAIKYTKPRIEKIGKEKFLMAVEDTVAKHGISPTFGEEK